MENLVNKLPKAFLKEMERLLGAEEFAQYLASFGKSWNRGLRVNERKISSEEFCKRCPYQLKPVSWIANGYLYDSSWTASKDVDYYGGLYYLQEPSAMTPASLLPVNPGDKVLDLCAAPGGKATELGVRLKGEGLLWANDISNSRAMALLKNLEIFGIPNICVTSETPERLVKALPGFFDKILVDAPCSGEGMFRREPAMIQDWMEKGPTYYQPIQQKILQETVKLLAPGGYLLYSTCTFSVRENEENIAFLLKEHSQMELVPLPLFKGAASGYGLSGVLRLFPHRIDGEGHFMALLRKRTEEEMAEKAATEKVTVENTAAEKAVIRKAVENTAVEKALIRKAVENTAVEKAVIRKAVENTAIKKVVVRKAIVEKKLNGKETAEKASNREKKREKDAGSDFAAWEIFSEDLKLSLEVSQIRLLHNKLYYLPKDFPEVQGLRYLRTGLLLGELKKGRFEPSQALAMSLRAEEFRRTVCFSREDERVIRYLKGETIILKEEEGEIKGWCLVCLEGGFPLGWAKSTGKTLKNKYYPGWRYQG